MASTSAGCAALETVPLSDYSALNVSVKCTVESQGYYLSSTTGDLSTSLVFCNKFRIQPARPQLGHNEAEGPGQPQTIQVTFSQGTDASTVSCPEDFQSVASLPYAPQSVAGIASFTALAGAQFTSC